MGALVPVHLCETPNPPARAQTKEATMQDKQSKQRANSAYSFAVKDGKMVFSYPNIGVLTFDPSKVSATNRARAMNHGLKQRIVDSAALDANKATGKTDPRAKYAEMERVIAHLESGSEEWNLKPQAGSGPISYVTQALVHLKTYQKVDVSTPELANAFVQRVSNIEKLGLKGEMGKARAWLEQSSAVIREAIAVVRAAETPVIDADAELAALMGADDGDDGDDLELANAEEMYRAGAIDAEEAKALGVNVEAIDAEIDPEIKAAE